MDNKSDLQEFSLHLSRREMRAYLNDKVSEQEATRIDKHLKFCEHCSIAMVTIVEQDDQANYKRNVNKVQHKLNVPIKKKYQWDTTKIKKGLIIAASVSMLSLTAYAFYSFVNKESTLERPGTTIPVKPVKEKPAAESEKNKDSKEETIKENKTQAPAEAMRESASRSQKEANKTKPQPVAPPASEIKKSKPDAPKASSTAVDEKKEATSTEVSNTVLVGRRKEPSAEEANTVVEQPREETENTEKKVMDANPSGGYGALNQYFAGNLQYPANARENEVEGQVPVEFLVEEDGTLSNFTVKRPLGFGCDKEAIRLIKEGPKWNPATEDGKSVSKTVTVTINFKLEE